MLKYPKISDISLKMKYNQQKLGIYELCIALLEN